MSDKEEEEEISEEYFCPICKDLMICPRIYNCGHTICEECMKRADETTYDESDTFSVPVFKCPICRKFEYTRWYIRPINFHLISILSSNVKDYEEKSSDYISKNKSKIVEIPDRVNLSYICLKKRVELCEHIYEKIFPHLYDAAISGKPYISISLDNNEDIDAIADLLAKKLFEENGIYRFLHKGNECRIDFILHKNPGINYWEYENENYDPSNPIVYESESLSGSLSPVRQTFNIWRNPHNFT